MASTEKIVLTNYALHRIREEAISHYKSRHIEDLDAELQTVFAIIQAFIELAQQQGWDVPEVAVLNRQAKPKC